MSRYYDDGDYDPAFQNQSEFWHANAQRALKGKRGRKVLADLRDALMALPEKRLIADAMCTVNPEHRKATDDRLAEDVNYGWQRLNFDALVAEQGEGVCAVGAYLWHRNVKAGMDPSEAFDALPLIYDDDNGEGMELTAQAARRAGVVYSLAWNLAYRNDEKFAGMAPEERHAAFIAWIDKELAEGATG